MAPLGPFSADRRVAVAVSGGADSMSLAWLLSHWGRPEAVLVDHGLRAESGAEVTQAAERLAGFGVPSTVLRLQDCPPSAAGARTARYDALIAHCRMNGLADVCLGHHARDQAETVLMRGARGSGRAGMAGMSAASLRGCVRLLRPLLAIQPADLRFILRAASIGWCEDPGNDDPLTIRGRWRQAFRHDPTLAPEALAAQAEAARDRRNGEYAIAGELAGGVSLSTAGVATITMELSAPALSAVIWAVSGRPYPPGSAQVGRALPMRAQTLHGCQIRRAGGAWRVLREPTVPERRFRAGRFNPDRALVPPIFEPATGHGDAERDRAPHV